MAFGCRVPRSTLRSVITRCQAARPRLGRAGGMGPRELVHRQDFRPAGLCGAGADFGQAGGKRARQGRVFGQQGRGGARLFIDQRDILHQHHAGLRGAGTDGGEQRRHAAFQRGIGRLIRHGDRAALAGHGVDHAFIAQAGVAAGAEHRVHVAQIVAAHGDGDEAGIGRDRGKLGRQLVPRAQQVRRGCPAAADIGKRQAKPGCQQARIAHLRGATARRPVARQRGDARSGGIGTAQRDIVCPRGQRRGLASGKGGAGTQRSAGQQGGDDPHRTHSSPISS